ncbi:MAG: sulfurtransferase-like selenium metabolism protein YedF [Eubacteriales bacterium]|nr:sulfurtransferase-like selenium metabolism protein YedF [Eubacteriales bacterium]
MTDLDAFGKACPLPVIMVKKVLEAPDFDGDDIVIRVDNEVAVLNLEKLAASYGGTIESKDIEGGYEVRFSIGDANCRPMTAAALDTDVAGKTANAMLITREVLGGGDDELGANLMQMFLFAVTQSDDLPETVAFMNGGVKLATIHDECIETLRELAAAGVRILVCGACLNFYGLTERLTVGEVSNAYEILASLRNRSVITL